jgi:hypothetical protein
MSTAAQRLVIGGTAADTRAPKLVLPPADLGWSLLGWAGLVFLVIGLLDQALGWFPLHFGNPEWEFGTVTRTLDTLPIAVLGLAMTLASAAQRRVPWTARAAAALCWLLAAVLLAGLVVFLLDVPVALKSVTQPAVRSGLERAIVKALVQGVLYPTVLAAIGWQGLRAARRAR